MPRDVDNLCFWICHLLRVQRNVVGRNVEKRRYSRAVCQQLAFQFPNNKAQQHVRLTIGEPLTDNLDWAEMPGIHQIHQRQAAQIARQPDCILLCCHE